MSETVFDAQVMAIAIKGDLEYAEAFEAVDHRTPETELHTKELRLAEAERDAAYYRLEHAERYGTPAEKAKAEADLKRWEKMVRELERQEDSDLFGSSQQISLGEVLGTRGDEETRRIRLETLQALNLYVFASGSADLGGAFRNFLAMVRKSSPHLLDGINRAELAILLGETRASTSGREIRLVEDLLRRWGFAGYRSRDAKDERARKKYSEVQKGNTNRLKGTVKKKESRKQAAGSGKQKAGSGKAKAKKAVEAKAA